MQDARGREIREGADGYYTANVKRGMTRVQRAAALVPCHVIRVTDQRVVVGTSDGIKTITPQKFLVARSLRSVV